LSQPRFDAKWVAETQLSKFESLIVMFKNDYFFFFARKNEKQEKKFINRINPIFGIILLLIDNDGQVTNHVTNVRLRDTS